MINKAEKNDLLGMESSPLRAGRRAGSPKDFINNFLSVFLPGVIILSAFMLMIYRMEVRAEKKSIEDKTLEHVKFQREMVYKDFRVVVSDLLFQSEQSDLRSFVAGDNNEKARVIKTLEQKYILLARKKGMYDQIRVIDKKGAEILRVDKGDGGFYSLPQEKFQSKADRYYFKKGIKLRTGEVYMSPFDLNVEHGKVERPLKPMIRFTTPIYDENGVNQGILIFNYLGEKLLTDIKNNYVNMPGAAMILNPEGFWILGSKAEDEWGFMLPGREEKKFGIVFPEAWKRISENDSGQFYTEEGMFTFTSLNTLMTDKAIMDQDEILSRGGMDKAGFHMCKMLSFVPDEVFYERLKPHLQNLIILYVVVVLLLGGASAVIVKGRIGRRKAEEKTRRRAAEWQITFDSMPDLAFILNAGGIIIRGNKAFFKAIGRSPEEVMGKKCHDALHNKSSICGGVSLEKMKNDLKTYTEEIDDSEMGAPFLITVAPIFDNKGEFVGSVHVAKDISERKEAEKKLREAIRIKSEFVSMASHELRTPLTVILGNITILSSGTAGEMNDHQKSLLERTKRNTERLMRLVNDVLDFQKIKTDGEKYEMEMNNINDAVKEAHDTLKVLAREKGVETILEVEENLPEILFDRDKIIQVLTNLIDNAIKFSGGGDITIATAGQPNAVHVFVKDSGIGIRSEDISKLFQTFEQLGRSSERKAGGTGLGLAISKGIIEKHHGKIWAESEFGKGSTFHFILPIKERRGG